MGYDLDLAGDMQGPPDSTPSPFVFTESLDQFVVIVSLVAGVLASLATRLLVVRWRSGFGTILFTLVEVLGLALVIATILEFLEADGGGH